MALNQACVKTVSMASVWNILASWETKQSIKRHLRRDQSHHSTLFAVLELVRGGTIQDTMRDCRLEV